MVKSLLDVNHTRAACTECQRRKQKCNREWPCNHCQKRKLPDKCQFNLPSTKGSTTSKKRQASFDSDVTSAASPDAKRTGFQFSGFATADVLASLGMADNNDAPNDGQYWASIYSCDVLDRAIKLVSGRLWVDSLVRSFFNKTNYHFYILYPPAFLEAYQQWWDRVSHSRPIALPWTCLLLTVCACAIQHADTTLQETIESDMDEDVNVLSEKYHNIARELGSVVPPGYHHIYNCQWLLHSTYWFMSQGRYLESWHVLSAAAREGWQLGLNKQSASECLPEFEREMRARVWCTIQILDWKISAGLSRKTIVNWSEVDITFPTLTVEGLRPSPILHMRLLSELITSLAVVYAGPTDVVTPTQIRHYKGMVENWMRSLPPVYEFDNPDISMDRSHPWIVLNRFYLHYITCFTMLIPMRPYMTKVSTSASPKEELEIRDDGIEYCLKTLRSTVQWVKHISHHGGGFHFAISCVFDSVASLCTTVIKDVDRTIAENDEICKEMDNAMTVLSQLFHVSAAAKMAHETLTAKFMWKLPRPIACRQRQGRARCHCASSTATVANEEDLVNAICTPAFSPCCYQDAVRNCSLSSSSVADEGSVSTMIQSFVISSSAGSELVTKPENHTGSLQLACEAPVQIGGFYKPAEAEGVDFTTLWNWQNVDSTCDQRNKHEQLQ